VESVSVLVEATVTLRRVTALRSKHANGVGSPWRSAGRGWLCDSCLLIISCVVQLQCLDDAYGDRGWLYCLRRPMA
jgi:hypothetical protein